MKKSVSLALTAGLVLSGMTALGTPAAWAAAPTSAVSMLDDQVTADNPLPETVSADALPTAQINGVVWQQLIVGNTVYAGGQFTSARPAGSPRGQNESPRGNILAYDIRTGALLPWAPMINGRVNDLEVSPDGSQLYVVGNFTEVDGQPRGRIAVFDLPSGALSTKVQPSASSVVQSVAATADTVYVGGYFGNLNNVYRPRVAAFSAANGATRTGFSVAVDDGMVQAIEVNSALNRLVFSGNFTSVGGSSAPGYGLAMLDLTTNQMLSLPINDRVRNAGPNSGITRLDSDSERFYGVGWHYGKGGTTEGSFAGSWSDGSLVWIEDCHGDTYDIHATPGAVYTASHKHYCGNSGGFPQTTPWTYYHSMASTNDVRGVNTPDIYGYPDHPGTPRPEFLNWFPTTAVGTYTGQDQAAWTVTGNDEYVVYGGEFPRVNGTAQEGLVRYTLRSSAPNKRGPVLQGAAINPIVRSLVPGSVRITMPGNHDQDDSLLTYRLHRGTQGTVVHEFQANARFWERKPTVWTDTDAQPGEQVRYRLEVVDPWGNIARSDWVSVTVATENTLGAYGAAILEDGAQKYWRLGESTTDVVDWAGADDTVAGAGVTRGTAGALIDQPDTASRFSGSNDGRVISRELVQGPDTFSLEVWFKTTTTNGGKIAGFGNRASGDSGSYDRHIYLDRQGRLVFGVYPGTARTIRSSVAVNDGAWHQAVATLGSDGMMLYLDGKRVASRTDTTNGQAYSGYWRLGGDRGWDNTSNFAGDIDEFSVYPSVLTPQQVNAHWMASGRPSAIAERPKDAYGATIYDANPDLYWRLSEEGGDVAADSSINGNSGTVLGARDQGGLGVIDGNASITLKRGNPGGNVVASRPTTNPVTFSQEFWLRTEAAGGGRILGFGNSANGTLSSNYDRHVYMLDDGRIRFGVWTGRAETVDSTSVLNDGQWHHVVSTFGTEGMRLYVDGQLEGSNPNTVAQNYTGYWKLGGDNTWGGNSETYYSGDLDEVAIYGRSMTEQEVQQHFTAGGGQLPNVDPVADFTWQGEGRTLTFDSSPSRDSDGSIESWSWDFGDGETSADAKPTHTYSKSGEFEVSLTVTDDRGGTDVVQSTVTIVNEAPVADFSSAVEARTVTFTSTATDPDGSVQTHAWDFGDGATSEEKNPVHTYAEAGSYTVTLVVTDDEGLQSAPTTRTVDTAAPNVAPTAAFTAAKDGLSVSFDSSGSSDPDGTVEAYAWDFGDGQTSSQAAPSHTYAQPGTYEVSLVVTDDDGAASEPAVRSVEVSEPVSGVVAADEFSRSVTDGWGAADTGGPWQTSGPAAYSVGDGAGQMAVRPGTATALLSQTNTDSVRVDAEFSVDKLLEAGYVSVIGRQIGSDRYYVRVRIAADGTLRVQSLRNWTAVGSQYVPDFTMVPGNKYRLSIEVTGTAPTTVKSKVWEAGQPEPDWARTATDAYEGLQVAGAVGVFGTVQGATSAEAPMTISWHSFNATDPTP